MSWNSTEPWFEEGLSFECARCGACCITHGEYAYVYLTDEELEKISAHLGIPKDAFVFTHCVRMGGQWVLRFDRPECPMLMEDMSCRIYPVRPVQCRTWPFWPENLTRRGWTRYVESFCPGVHAKRIVDRSLIQSLAEEMQETQSRR